MLTREELLKRARAGAGDAAPTAQASTEAPQTSSQLTREELLRRAGGGGSAAPTAPQGPSAAPQGGRDSGLLGSAASAIYENTPVGMATNAGMRVADMVGLGDMIRGNMTGAGETAATMASGMVAEPVAGLAGLLGGGTMDERTQRIEDVRADLTYMPKTEEGKAALQAVGAFFEPLGDALTGTSEALGDTAEYLGADPALSAMLYTLPEAALSIGPAAVAKRAKDAAKLAKQTQKVQIATKELSNPAIATGTSTGASWKLGADGIAKPNTVGKELMRGGIEAKDAALVTNSNKATKIQMDTMIKEWDKMAKGTDATASPTKVIGQTAARSVGQINEARKKVGAQIDELVSGKMGETKVDIKQPLGEFYGKLNELGVRTRVSPDGKRRLDFDGTDLDLATFGSVRRILDDAYQMTNKPSHTLADAHKLKSSLDNLLDAGKLEQGGELGNAGRVVAGLRKGINETAGKQVDGYAQLNAKYGDLRSALDSFDSYKPAGVSWDNPKVVNNLASAMKSAGGDSAQFNNMMDSLASAGKVMKDAGMKPFDVDVIGLARFNDMMNDQLLRTISKNGSKDLRRSVGNNLSGMAISGAVGNKFGVANNAAGLLRNSADAATVNKLLADNSVKYTLIRRGLTSN